MKKLTPIQEDIIGDFVYHEKKCNDKMICGLCSNYDSDTCLCDKHPDWEELVETDTCDDYEELS